MFGLAAALGGAKPDGAGPNIPWPRPDAMAGEGIGEAAKPFGVPLSTTTIVVSEGGPPKAVAEAQVLEAEAVLPAPKADEADNPPKAERS